MTLVSLKNAMLTAIIALAVVLSGCINQTPPQDENKPPVADFTISKNPANEKESVNFNGINSKDIDGQITRWLWDFGDGTQAFDKIEVSHIFEKGGTYTITLTVIDNKGKENSKQQTIKVNYLPKPKIDIEKTEVKVNENISFSAENSKDIDGTIKEYFWDFGDSSNATGVEVFHQYKEEGTYTVILMVKDDMGATATLTIEIKVEKRKFKITWNETQKTAFENYTNLFLWVGQPQDMQDNITEYNITRMTFTLTWTDRYVNIDNQIYNPTPNDNISLFVKTPENLTDKQYSMSGNLNITMIESLVPSEFEMMVSSIDEVLQSIQIYKSEKGRGIWDATATLEEAGSNMGVPDYYEQVECSVVYYYYSAVIEEI